MKPSPAGGAIQRPITLSRETPLHGTSAHGPANRWLSTTKLEKSCMSVHQDTGTEAVVYVRLLDEGQMSGGQPARRPCPTEPFGCYSLTVTVPTQKGGNSPRRRRCVAL